MTANAQVELDTRPTIEVDPALACLALVAGYYRIAADPVAMRRDLGLSGRPFGVDEVLRAAGGVGLKARTVAKGLTIERLASVPIPSILELADAASSCSADAPRAASSASSTR